MSITDMQYNAWLKKQGVKRDMLFIATHKSGVEYFSLLGKTTRPNDTPANTAFLQRFTELPSLIVESINTEKSVGDISVINSGIDHWQEQIWQTIEVYLGDKAWLASDYRKIISAVVDTVSASADVFTFTIRDKKVLFDQLPQESYVLGSVSNISPDIIDSANLIYRAHPDNTAIIDAVRDNGVPLTLTTDYTLNNDGTFTLVSSAAGKITCDAHHVSINTAADICQYVAKLCVSSEEVDTVNLAEFGNTANLGVYLTASQSIGQWLSDITASVGGIWRFNALGLFQLVRFELAKQNSVSITPNIIELNSVDLVAIEQPYLSVKMQYKYNWTVQGESSLSASLSAADRLRYSSQASTIKVSNNVALNNNYALATQEVRNSYFVNEADAAAEAQRIADQRQALRKIYRLTAFVAPFSVQLCDSVSVKYPRFGFSLGVDSVVISRQQNTVNSSMEIEVWL